MDPLVLLNLMVELAGLEEELADAQATLVHHRRRDRHLRALQQEYDTDAEEAEDAGRDAVVSLRQTEGLIRDVEAALARKRDQVVGITDNRQYRALQDEIRSLEEELDRLETAGLALLDRTGRKDGEAGQASQERDTQEIRGAEELERMREESARASVAEQEIAREIERLIALMPDAEGRHVNRLRSHHVQAVVRVQSGACGGCFGQLPIQQALDADQGKALVRCPSCARFVVRKSWK